MKSFRAFLVLGLLVCLINDISGCKRNTDQTSCINATPSSPVEVKCCYYVYENGGTENKKCEGIESKNYNDFDNFIKSKIDTGKKLGTTYKLYDCGDSTHLYDPNKKPDDPNKNPDDPNKNSDAPINNSFSSYVTISIFNFISLLLF